VSGVTAPDRCCRACGTPLSRPDSLRKLMCLECRWESNNRRLLAADRRRPTKTTAGTEPAERRRAP
jgi:hypothetical protein